MILFNFPYFVNVIRNYSVPVFFFHFIVFPWLLTSSSSINSNNLYYFQTNDAILTVSFFFNGNLLIIVNTMIFYGTEVQEYLIICVLDLPWNVFVLCHHIKEFEIEMCRKCLNISFVTPTCLNVLFSIIVIFVIQIVYVKHLKNTIAI